MARRKVKLELISNEFARKASFKKRKAGLLKKIEELTTLCGVMACAIIFSTFDYQPVIWPSLSEAFLVLDELKNLPTKKKGKHMMNQAILLKESISKFNMKLDRQRRKNKMLEVELLLAKCAAGKDLLDLNYFKTLDEKIHLVDKMIEFITDKIEHAEAENEEK